MAGIGFELKKIYKNKGILNYVKAYFYSSIVIVGPLLLCILLITIFKVILMMFHDRFYQDELFISIVIYSFVFSLIITSGFTMLISRFISDKIYENNYKEILPSFYGVIIISFIIGGVCGGIFIYTSNLSVILKIISYVLFMTMIMIWIQMVYITALKDYLKLVRSFCIGVIIAIILELIFIQVNVVEPVVAMILSLDIGFIIIAILFMNNIRSFFSVSNNNNFSFISYFDKVPSLVFIGLFYTIGIYIHNIILWNSNYSIRVGGVFLVSPSYDVPSFYAFLTIIPTLIIFNVKLETSFFKKYKLYFDTIIHGGNLKEILDNKKAMIETLVSELKQTMEIQMFFTLVFMVMGIKLLPIIGQTALSIEIYTMLVLGSFLYVFMFLSVLILLYFDDRKGALILTTVFLVTNIIFTYITMILGENYFGCGFFLSALVSLIIGSIRLSYYLKNLDYYVFCRQPINKIEDKSYLNDLSLKYNHYVNKEKRR